jgi:hypothetical protein
MPKTKSFWKWLIGMPDYETFGRDYLLLHEILETLRKIGLNVISSGSEEKGHVPFYEFSVPSARLHFGTLVALLNKSEHFKPEPGKINYWQNIVSTKEDVIITKYGWIEVSEAIEALANAEEVKKEVAGGFLEPGSKIISLTEKGNGSLNSKKYLKKYQKERNAEILFKSTVSTNLWMRIFTGVLAISALLTFVFQFNTCTKPKMEAPALIERPKCKKCGIDSIYIVNDSLPPLRGEHSKEPSKKK